MQAYILPIVTYVISDIVCKIIGNYFRFTDDFRERIPYVKREGDVRKWNNKVVNDLESEIGVIFYHLMTVLDDL
jgi:hypothetical protein